MCSSSPTCTYCLLQSAVEIIFSIRSFHCFYSLSTALYFWLYGVLTLNEDVSAPAARKKKTKERNLHIVLFDEKMRMRFIPFGKWAYTTLGMNTNKKKKKKQRRYHWQKPTTVQAQRNDTQKMEKRCTLNTYSKIKGSQPFFIFFFFYLFEIRIVRRCMYSCQHCFQFWFRRFEASDDFVVCCVWVCVFVSRCF